MSFKRNTYAKNDPVYLNMEKCFHPKESFKAVANSIRLRYGNGPIDLIDVGCASGAFLKYVKHTLNIKRGTGMDISEAHLKLARKIVPGAKFIQGSILNPRDCETGKYDVCTCLGTLSIFDEFECAIRNLCRLVKKGGYIYIYDAVNDDPIDVLMRYRRVEERKCSRWMSAFNIRSAATYVKIVKQVHRNARVSIEDFRLPLALPKGEDPMRAWTIQTESNANQIVVGTGQMLNFKIIEIEKSKERNKI